MADALRVQLSTGARIGEIVGMTTGEIDCAKWLWLLPGARSKNGHPRTTPLVGLARTIIEAHFNVVGDGPLFLSESGAVLRSAAVGTALLSRRDLMPIAPFRTHDLRRTAASLMYENGIPRDGDPALL